MAKLPSFNDREYDLLKKITENTALFSAGASSFYFAAVSPTATGAENSTAIMEAFGESNFVWIPEGDFEIASTIAIPPGGALIGLGDKYSHLHYTGTGVAITLYAESVDFSDGLFGGKIQNLLITGTSAAAGAISISDVYRVAVDTCTIREFTGGFGIELRNREFWTEGAMLTFCQIRKTLHAFKITIDDTGDPTHLSFAETTIFRCSVVLDTGTLSRVITANAFAYLYAYSISIKVNIELDPSTVPTTDKAALIELGSGASMIDGHLDLYSEITLDRPFWRFKLADNAALNGFGTAIIKLPPSMTRNVNGTNYLDSVGEDAILYMGPNSEMIPATGIDSENARIGSGLPVYLQREVAADTNLAAIYFASGTFEVNLLYTGTGRQQSMTLLISTNKDADDAAASNTIDIVSNQVFAGAEVFPEESVPYFSFSTVNGNAFLFLPMENTVAGGILGVTVTMKTLLPSAGTSDFGVRRPFLIFPDMTGISLTSVIARAQPVGFYKTVTINGADLNISGDRADFTALPASISVDSVEISGWSSTPSAALVATVRDAASGAGNSLVGSIAGADSIVTATAINLVAKPSAAALSAKRRVTTGSLYVNVGTPNGSALTANITITYHIV